MPTTTNYIWDEQNYLAEADGTNTIQTVYTNEPQQYGNLVSSRISGTTSYHHFDALGSTRQLTNAAGSVTDTVVYDAWGNVITRSGATGISLLWIGQVGYYFDTESGLHWVRTRPYRAIIARWFEADAIRKLGAIVPPYVYALNNPVAEIDPSGNAPNEVEPPPESPALPEWVPPFERCENEHEMQKCIAAAYNRAMRLLLNPATINCFSTILNDIGSICTSGQLVNCLIATMEATTYECAKCGSSGGYTLRSPCIETRETEDKNCKAKGNKVCCTACQEPAPHVNICYRSRFVETFCGPNATEPDEIVNLLIHEASHGCVGPHLVPKLETKGILHDNCARPDAYAVDQRFAECTGLKPTPR
jgi:RHS repeat-associated protein